MRNFTDLIIHPLADIASRRRVNEVKNRRRSLESRMYEDALALLHDLTS